MHLINQFSAGFHQSKDSESDPDIFFEEQKLITSLRLVLLSAVPEKTEIMNGWMDGCSFVLLFQRRPEMVAAN